MRNQFHKKDLRLVGMFTNKTRNRYLKRRTELYENLYEFLMDRSTLKPHNFGCYSSDIPNLQDMLQTLGKFAWEALQNDDKQLLIKKV